MAHEIAKSLLEKAKNDAERAEAIGIAIQLRMPLNEIQDYLDWLDRMRGNSCSGDQTPDAGEDPKS